MQEVTVRIKFNRVCPGSTRKRTEDGNVEFCMLRSPDNRVMFLATWWRAIMSYAAQVINKHQKDVRSICWDPIVDGEPQKWRRYSQESGDGRRRRFAVHEAFLPGSVIGVHCVLPATIGLDDFWSLLDVAGAYKGISPYKPSDDYGTFEVVSVTHRKRVVDGEDLSSC